MRCIKSVLFNKISIVMNSISPESQHDLCLEKLSQKSPQNRTFKIYVPEGSDPPIELLLKNMDFQTSNISEANFIIYPYLVRGKTVAKINKISKQFKSFNKKVIVFILDDYEGRYSFHKNLFLLRTSAQSGKLAINELIMPYLWECKDEPFVPALSTDIPSIGFCGLVTKYRQNLVFALENSPFINCHFIKRDSFWGGKPHDTNVKSDFWNNLQENQFALAPRGGGNFSMRFYQALSVGRIPVLINTSMPLPLSNLIPWKDIIVFEENEKECIRRLREIFDADQVVALQQMCYKIFHGYLSRKVFLAHLLQQLDCISEVKTSPWWTRWTRK